jgi:rhodanese-related sulfurtransferase
MRIVEHSEVERAVRRHGQIVDVLPDHEYRTTHIRHAIHIRLKSILTDAGQRLDRERPVTVYCRDSL